MSLRRGGHDLDAALQRWREAGLISAPTADALRAFEARRATGGPAPGATSRVADAGAVVGAALIVAAAMVLAFAQFEHDFAARIAVLSVVGAVALGASFGARRLRLGVASDALAGAAVLLLTVCLASALDEIGEAGQSDIGWVLICAAAVVLGAAVWWTTRARSAGSLAVIAWVALPAALAVGGGSEPGEFEGPFEQSVSSASAWAALALMTVAAALLAIAAQSAARRGWLAGRVNHNVAVGSVLLASSALSVAIVMLAIARYETGFFAAALFGAVAATAFAVWRREWQWLLSAAVLYVAAAGFAMGDLGGTEGRALGLAVLVLSFFPFLPLARRLPAHWVASVWEALVWLMALLLASVFAFSSAGWPAAGGVWAAALILVAALLRRWLALAFGVIGLYVTFLAVVIEAFDANVGAGFGTLLFGVLVLAAVILWRRGRVDTDQGRS